jgi:ankyrin repeat protein
MEHAREILTDDLPDMNIDAALLDACRNGRCDIVALLTNDARFDQSVEVEYAFQMACANGHVEVVSLLLHHPCFSLGAQRLKLAVELSAYAGHCDVVALFVQDARINPGFGKLFTLELYCLVGDIERVKEALDGPDFLGAPLPRLLLTAASRTGRAGVVQLLLTDPRLGLFVDKNSAIQSSGEYSEYGPHSAVTMSLAEPRVDPAAYEAIGVASNGGHERVVKLLLADPRIDPSVVDNVAIRRASMRGHSSVVKLLLRDPRVDPTAEDDYAIRYACRNGHESVVKLLLADLRVDPTASNNFAISIASSGGHASVVKLLLADPRVDPAANKNFAILKASILGYANVVRRLLADPRVDPSMGHPTVLERASGQGYFVVVQMLLEHPKVVVTKAALVAADEQHHGDIIRLLIEKQPRVLHDLFEDAPCMSGSVLGNELLQYEKASALTFLLSVERCGGFLHVSDVLREVIMEYACFELIAASDWEDYMQRQRYKELKCRH